MKHKDQSICVEEVESFGVDQGVLRSRSSLRYFVAGESQIDYFSVRQADRKHVRDCTVIPGEAAVKQHRILVMDMRIRSVHTGYRSKQKARWKLKGENLVTFKCEVQEKMNN